MEGGAKFALFIRLATQVTLYIPLNLITKINE
jgi:hypothetical protein